MATPPRVGQVLATAQAPRPLRRHWLRLATAWAALPLLGAAGSASAARAEGGESAAGVFPQMTEGPFYPNRRWRGTDADWDADLTRVKRLDRTRIAKGEHLGLDLQVIDSHGQRIDAVDCEIWQCDTSAVYRHPAQADQAERADTGFQGFGAARSGRDGRVTFRTIRPVPYPGRTPHIHFKLRHPAFGELTSQLFVTGDPGNDRDFLWRRLSAEGRAALGMQLQRTTTDGLVWQVTHTLVVPA